MTDTIITFGDLETRNAKLKREFAELKASYKKNQPLTDEQLAEAERLKADAKQLNTDMDIYIEQHNIRLK